MITIPTYAVAGLLALAVYALAGWAYTHIRAVLCAQHTVDRILTRELGPRPPFVGDQEHADRADRGQRP